MSECSGVMSYPVTLYPSVLSLFFKVQAPHPKSKISSSLLKLAKFIAVSTFFLKYFLTNNFLFWCPAVDSSLYTSHLPLRKYLICFTCLSPLYSILNSLSLSESTYLGDKIFLFSSIVNILYFQYKITPCNIIFLLKQNLPLLIIFLHHSCSLLFSHFPRQCLEKYNILYSIFLAFPLIHGCSGILSAANFHEFRLIQTMNLFSISSR